MEFVLPTQKSPVVTKSPVSLILFSAPKVGKTTLASGLENNLIIDLESGTDHVSAMIVKIKSYMELHALCEQIKAAGKPYRYITLDTATALEDMCLPLALKLYQKTPKQTWA